MAEDESRSSESYAKAKAACQKAVRHFPEAESIGAREIQRLRDEGKNVLLIDVRQNEEMAVSMLRGAVSSEAFEKTPYGEAAAGKKPTFGGITANTNPDSPSAGLLVPYCTAGYRSGRYAKKLVDLGYPSVRNSEGVVLWTHEVGEGLVKPKSDTSHGWIASDEEVKRVHVYGQTWNHASDDFEAVAFTPASWLSSYMSGARQALGRLFGGQ